jgi:cytochrome c peroxidase
MPCSTSLFWRFWDGRTVSLAEHTKEPLINPSATYPAQGFPLLRISLSQYFIHSFDFSSRSFQSSAMVRIGV